MNQVKKKKKVHSSQSLVTLHSLPLIIIQGTSPNTPDENSYTPLHAAASWAHVEILRYLIEKGGDINLVDADGETPLFLVESADMARMVISLGGDPNVRNLEGLSVSSFLLFFSFFRVSF